MKLFKWLWKISSEVGPRGTPENGNLNAAFGQYSGFLCTVGHPLGPADTLRDFSQFVKYPWPPLAVAGRQDCQLCLEEREKDSRSRL